MKTLRVLLVGGGSGGHAYPLIAVAQAIKEQAQQKNRAVEFLMIGVDGFARRAVQESGIPFRSLIAGKLRRYASPWLFWDLLKMPFALIQSLWRVFWFMPDVTFSKGGYDSFMPVIASKLYFIPVFIHESDTMPGLVNRLLAGFARGLFLAFPSAQQHIRNKNTIITGNPVRKELLNADRTAALQKFSFQDGQKTLLIFGGSQGAKEINEIIVSSLLQIVQEFQVIHQCGQSQYEAVKSATDTLLKESSGEYAQALQNKYRLFPFLELQDLSFAYAAADVIVSRAGAGSLFEIAAVGKPAVIIPLASAAGNHQYLNAVEFSKYGGVIVEGANMTPHILLNQIRALLDPSRRDTVREQLKGFAKPDAASRIASTILAGIL